QAEIKEFLRKQLPDYMVPSMIITLDLLPLTPNGKLDRRALEILEEEDGEQKEFQRPLSPIEELLTSIWCEILDKPNISINDNFFDLGGHSLKATQVLSRIRKVFGTEIALYDMFSNPTIAGLSEVIQNARCLENQNFAGELIERATDRNNSLGFELSFAQQRLWFLEQLSPGNISFNIPSAVQLKGDLNISALQASLTEIVRRHESLRTEFRSANGKPLQFIRDAEPAEIEVIDLSFFDNSMAFVELQKAMNDEIAKPFDLSHGPLYRIKLFKTGISDYIFMITMHHIISDGWSMVILIRELVELYKSFVNNEDPHLPDLEIQYTDFSEWQRKWLTGETLKRQLLYWKNELEGIKSLIELPTDFPRPAVQTFNGATRKTVFTKTILEKLREFSRMEGVTPYMTLLAAFQSLLHRYTGSDDLVVGTPVANRNRIETEHLIGFFVNTQVMRVRFTGNPTFSEVLKQVREKSIMAFSNQDVPFEYIVEEIQPERDLSHSPIFQVAFVYQNFPINKLQLPGLDVSYYEMENPSAKYDLTLTVIEGAEGLSAYWEYNTDLFTDSAIMRMTSQFNILTEYAIGNPKMKISDLPLMEEQERNKMLIDWNLNNIEYPGYKCVQQWFEDVAEMQPEAVALTFTEPNGSEFRTSEITYCELNKRANQLARYLKRAGCKRETIIGLLLQRSMESVIAVLAVLKAGGAFLPIDPSYPQDRIEFMLKDSGAGILLTESSILINNSGFPGKAICIDAEIPNIIKESNENLFNIVTPDNLAYVIYTSGSTGLPKGAMLHHRGLCNLAFAQQKVFKVNAGSRVFQFASPSFDASVWEMVMALLSGATLNLFPQENASSIEHLAEIIKESGATVITLPPSILARLPEKNPDGIALLEKLRTIIVAGEKCPVEIANYWSKRSLFYNAYGPTETTVCASLQLCNNDYRQNIPIGRPLSNIELYVLDKYLNPVPVGIPGELYIGGTGVGRGYLNRPDLTAEKFIPDPFNKSAGMRLYKSGDLVRYLEDGKIEFIGRI
ncbi:MAG: amino acid adenylation domain-containing protein, partial [Ignavibacteriales bacterium]